MDLVSKYFTDLTTRELYEILKARFAVFVVEQNCVYQDIDGQDPESLHVFFEDEGRIAAYLRAFVKEPGVVIDRLWVGHSRFWVIPGTEDIPFVQTWPQVLKKRGILSLIWIAGAAIVAGMILAQYKK